MGDVRAGLRSRASLSQILVCESHSKRFEDEGKPSAPISDSAALLRKKWLCPDFMCMIIAQVLFKLINEGLTN